MIFLIHIFVGVILQKFCFCILEKQASNLWDDVLEIKETIFHLKELTKMFGEENFLSLHTLLTSMNNDTKKLQERAQIWDTINDQLPVLDIKLDVISKIQNNTVDGLDSKLNLCSFEIDDVSTIINVIKNSSNDLSHKFKDNKKDNELEKVTNEITIVGKETQEERSLIVSNYVDYTFCSSVKNVSGLFKFYTSYDTLIEGARDYGSRLCQDGWLVIQKRDTFEHQENFNRSWDQYKHGFGDLRTEFWFGNNFLNRLSNKNDLKLRVELESFDGGKVWAQYETFKVGNEQENFLLNIGDYTGTAYDSFSYHNNRSFSTYDKRNDDRPESPCALFYGSGWWFKKCFNCNLNGIYYNRNNHTNDYQGIVWEGWLYRASLKSTKMMVKPKGNLIQLNDLTYKIYYLLEERNVIN